MVIPREGAVFDLVDKMGRIHIDDYTTLTSPLLSASYLNSKEIFLDLHRDGFQVIALGVKLHCRLSNLKLVLTTA